MTITEREGLWLDLKHGHLVEHGDLDEQGTLIMVEFATLLPISQFGSDDLSRLLQLPQKVVLLTRSSVCQAFNSYDLADLFDLLFFCGRHLSEVRDGHKIARGVQFQGRAVAKFGVLKRFVVLFNGR